MGRHVDVDDLIDAEVVASMLGLSSRSAVSVYRRRYGDFPAPVRVSDGGRCLLWLRQEVARWATGHEPPTR